MYVVKDLVIMLTYTNTLEYTLVIHLINVIYVAKDLVRHLTYRHTLEHIVTILTKSFTTYMTFIRFITSVYSNVFL
jgi:hypothetical protein